MQTLIFAVLTIVALGLTGWTIYDIKRQGKLSSADSIAILAVIITLAMAAYSAIPEPSVSVAPANTESDSVSPDPTPTSEVILLSQFKVDAQRQRNPTGIYVEAGDLMQFEYLEGKWSGISKVPTFLETCRSQFSDKRAYPVPPDEAGYTPIGYIKDTAFWIGCDPIDVEAPASGEPMLGMNDCLECFSNNIGEIYISITIERR